MLVVVELKFEALGVSTFILGERGGGGRRGVLMAEAANEIKR